MERGKHDVAGQRSLHGDLGGLDVTDFADHDGIRILSEERTQRRGERQADLVVDRDLHDAFDLVFDGIFGGEDLDVLGVHFFQGRVKRGRLAGAGRAGDDEDAVRAADHAADAFLDVILHRERLETQVDDRLVEDSEHHGFAELRRERGYAEVDLAAADGRLDATVLRHAALGDVQGRKHLDAGDDGRGEVLRRRGHLVERAVDAQADAELVLEGLEVDVRSLGLDTFLQDEVDEADDRGLAGLLGDVLVGDGGGVDFAELAEEVLHRGGSGFAVDAHHAGLDLRRVGDAELDLALEDETQLVDDGGIERILGQQGELAGFVGDRQHDILVGLGRLEQLDERLARVGGDGGVIRGTEVVGDGLQDGAAFGEPGVDEAVDEGLAGGGGRFPDLFGLGRRHEAGLEGDITDHVTMVVEHGKKGG